MNLYLLISKNIYNGFTHFMYHRRNWIIMNRNMPPAHMPDTDEKIYLVGKKYV